MAVDVETRAHADYLRKHKLALAAICITHRHFDHLYGVATLEQATGAPVYVPKRATTAWPGRNRARADCGRRVPPFQLSAHARGASASAVWTVGF